ncbi:MAG: hypothetical protein AAB583_04335, partial [Patescibacteria group bacterium]
MAETGEVQPQNINSRINDLLKRTPSGPDFAQSTVRYCQESITFGLGKIEKALKDQFPAEAGLVTTSLESAKSDFVSLPSSSLFAEGERVYLTVPSSGKKIPANRILESTYYANPRLGAFEYAIALYPPTSQRFAYGRHPGFDRRFTNVVKTGEIPLDSPSAEIMAVAYIIQVAKISGVEDAKKLLQKSQLYGGVASREYLETNLQNTVKQTYDIRRHQAFIAEGLGTIKRVAEQNGLDEKQVQLLLDIAFIKNRAFDQGEEFMQVFRPIVRFIAQGDWQQAFTHRDFLLKYFVSSFPEWRQRTYQEEAGVKSFESMKQVVQATKKGELVLYEEDV